MAITADEYLRQLQALLPRGAAWAREPGAVLTNLLGGLAEEFARVDLRGDQLIDEADPRTTSELLVDWERVAGLPDTCVVAAQGTQQRRNALLARLTNTGGQSRAYFIALLASLGFVVTLTEFREHNVEDEVEYQLFGTDWNFAWQINAPLNTVLTFTVEDTAGDALAAWSNESLECVIKRLKPAHTVPIFAYT